MKRWAGGLAQSADAQEELGRQPLLDRFEFTAEASCRSNITDPPCIPRRWGDGGAEAEQMREAS